MRIPQSENLMNAVRAMQMAYSFAWWHKRRVHLWGACQQRCWAYIAWPVPRGGPYPWCLKIAGCLLLSRSGLPLQSWSLLPLRCILVRLIRLLGRYMIHVWNGHHIDVALFLACCYCCSSWVGHWLISLCDQTHSSRRWVAQWLLAKARLERQLLQRTLCSLTYLEEILLLFQVCHRFTCKSNHAIMVWGH